MEYKTTEKKQRTANMNCAKNQRNQAIFFK